MTDPPANPNSALAREIVDCIRVLMDSFPLDPEQAPLRVSPKLLGSSLEKLEESPPRLTHYLMLAFSAVTIRWAAHETGRDEKEMLDELAKSFHAIQTE